MYELFAYLCAHWCAGYLGVLLMSGSGQIIINSYSYM